MENKKKFFFLINSNFLFGDCSLMLNEFFANFLNNINFQRLGDFLKMKTLPRVRRARGRVILFFGIELLKIYLIGRNLSLFENCKKVLNHSTLQYTRILEVPFLSYSIHKWHLNGHWSLIQGPEFLNFNSLYFTRVMLCNL